VTAIIAAGGSGRRLGAPVPKQLLTLGGRSILEWSIGAFDSHPAVTELVVALPEALIADASRAIGATRLPLRIVAGGDRRQDSVANAFDAVSADAEVVLVHDAARPFVSSDVISRAIDAAAERGAAVVAVHATDTVKRVESRDGVLRVVQTLPREDIFLAQTPQAFTRRVLRDATALGRAGVEATDEAALAERAGHPVQIVEGDPANVKITTASDLEAARARQHGSASSMRTGIGYDLHRLVEGRPLILGGVTIPSPVGALGHSDADAACHSITDAILGGAGLGDIGRHFPDSDPAWKGASSIDLLQRAAAMVREAGFIVESVDVVVVLERPRIAPFVERIRAGLAAALGVPVERVSVKGKSNEGVDAVGRGEAIASHAVALLTHL
jgi:2-C-methyl-D-erythritol 4-phosphate cytidylyltransferase/2-C-methyl-D-erythritol 2,4-cyclodiphosphate synthase